MILVPDMRLWPFFLLFQALPEDWVESESAACRAVGVNTPMSQRSDSDDAPAILRAHETSSRASAHSLRAQVGCVPQLTCCTRSRCPPTKGCSSFIPHLFHNDEILVSAILFQGMQQVRPSAPYLVRTTTIHHLIGRANDNCPNRCCSRS
jgi:hypothetical protein